MLFGRRKKNDCGDADADSLFDAVETGDLAEVKRLVVDCGVDPNIRKYGNTPLHVCGQVWLSQSRGVAA